MLNKKRKYQLTVLCVNTGETTTRTMAETGEISRLQKWEPAERISVRGNELAAFQLVQQVKNIQFY